LDCCHVCKTCAFHDALQTGKQKEVHRTPLIWCPQAPDQESTVDGLLRHTSYISCAIVSLCVCNWCNSRTYCTCTTVSSSWNRLCMWSVLHPQEKWCVMAFVTGNC
jgi:hypothetical protein